ncbi:MAG: NAD(P)-binding domain-containing protein [Rubrivivax sp.]
MEAAVLHALIGAIALVIHLVRRRRRDRRNEETCRESERQGLNEPPSLHPAVDPGRCIGSGACVHACPESALGIGGKAVLINGSACIGHGACEAACPVHAIQLVFGTEKRGIDIPEVAPNFESNVPGLFIAGELGGMGLVRKAAEQGRQAIDHIRRRHAWRRRARRAHRRRRPGRLLLGGPGGAERQAALPRHRAGRFARRGRLPLPAPEDHDDLAGEAGAGRQGQGGGDRQGGAARAVERHRAAHRPADQLSGERPESLERSGEGFVVHTNQGSHRAASVLLAIGRRGTPRKLEVPGEETAKASTGFIDPAQYRGQQVLVVGGGDSALEAAVALAEEPGTRVALSYRGKAFARVKEKNRVVLKWLLPAAGSRCCWARRSATSRRAVTLKGAGEPIVLKNDAVIVCAGGVLPTALLQKAGIHFATKYGTA